MKGFSFYGYQQKRRAHHLRPWWRWNGRKGRWTRRIGHKAIRPALGDPGDASDVKGGLDRGYTLAEWEAAQVKLLAEYDRKNPMKCPDPQCGQVWVGLGRTIQTDILVITVFRENGQLLSVVTRNLSYQPDQWPPEGAVLVAGPGAPWAPADWETK